MKVAIYARVSSPLPKVGDKEAEEDFKKRLKQDTENQIVPLKEYVTNKQWELYEIYVDHISSIKKKPNFNRMMEDARWAKFDCILVWKIDRFARSMQDFIYWIKELDRLGVRFIAITQNIDTDKQSPSGRLLMSILAAFAEFERDIIIERIHASIAMRKAKGLPIGRTKTIARLGRLYEMREEGFSIRAIAKELGVSKSLVERRLNEEAKKTIAENKAETNSQSSQFILQEDN